MSRRASFAVQTALARALVAVAGVAPRSWLLAAGATVGSLGYLLDRRHRRVGIDNLLHAFPDAVDERAARHILHRCWRHFGRITFDTLAFPRLGPDSVERLVRFEGLEHPRAALAAGRGMLQFTGHFGHWELAALMQGHMGLPLSVVARPLDNPGLERLLATLRTGSGNTVVYKRSAVRETLRVVQRGGAVAIVIDQDARGHGVFVPFFGIPASTTPTLALLALRTGAPVVPASCVPLDDGTYRVVYEPPMEIERSGDREADVLRLTAACTAIIERWVRRDPHLWLWMHQRWKTQPPPR